MPFPSPWHSLSSGPARLGWEQASSPTTSPAVPVPAPVPIPPAAGRLARARELRMVMWIHWNVRGSRPALAFAHLPTTSTASPGARHGCWDHGTPRAGALPSRNRPKLESPAAPK